MDDWKIIFMTANLWTSLLTGAWPFPILFIGQDHKNKCLIGYADFVLGEMI